MTTSPTPRQTTGRWRRPLAALAVGLVSTTGAAALIGSAPEAGAIPICTDPAGCTGGGGGTGTSTSTPFDWQANVQLLDQSTGGMNRGLDGTWLGLSLFPTIGGGNGVIWSDSAKTEGVLHTATKPTASRIGFRMSELGKSGPACRLPAGNTMPPSNQTLRILAAPTTGKSASDLSTLAAGFRGDYQIGDADVTISSATLDSRSDGLFLTLQGHVFQDNQFPIPNVDADFTYKVLVHPQVSSNALDMHSVVNVVADKGDLNLVGGNVLDKILLEFASDKEPTFRSTVADKATAAFNDAIASDPTVTWFTSLGYTLSARQVTTSPAGFALDGSFCRLGS